MMILRHVTMYLHHLHGVFSYAVKLQKLKIIKINNITTYTQVIICKITYVYVLTLSRDSSVGIATCRGLGGPGIECRWGGARFSAPISDRPWGPPSLLYNWYRVSFPGLERPGHDIDHSPLLVSRLKKK
jgi:hypothetical protein